MREEDTEDIRHVYREYRVADTIYGFMVSIIGFGLMFWLPGSDWMRHATGWGVILYGGSYINRRVVREWYDLFAAHLPFIRKRE